MGCRHGKEPPKVPAARLHGAGMCERPGHCVRAARHTPVAGGSEVLGEHGLVYGDVGSDAEGPEPTSWAGVEHGPVEEPGSLPEPGVDYGSPPTFPDSPEAEDSDNGGEGDDGDEDLDAEGAVIRVMEFLSVSRALAVDLLDSHHGSASRVICAVLDGQQVPA